MLMNALDYEIHTTKEGEVQIWTPDTTIGAIIGSGATIKEAKQDAVLNMLSLCQELISKEDSLRFTFEGKI